MNIKLAPHETVAYPLQGHYNVEFDITSTHPMNILILDEFANQQGSMVEAEASCKGVTQCSRSLTLQNLRMTYYLVISNPTGTDNVIGGEPPFHYLALDCCLFDDLSMLIA